MHTTAVILRYKGGYDVPSTQPGNKAWASVTKQPVTIDIQQVESLPTMWEWMAWACGQMIAEPKALLPEVIVGIDAVRQARIAKFTLHAVLLPSNTIAILATQLDRKPIPDNVYVAFKDGEPFVALLLLQGRLLPKTLSMETYMACPANVYSDLFKIERVDVSPTEKYNAFGQATDLETLRLTVDLEQEQAIWSRCLAAHSCTLRTLRATGANTHPEYPHLFLVSETLLQPYAPKQAKRKADRRSGQHTELKEWIDSAPLPPLATQRLREGLFGTRPSKLSEANINALLQTDQAWDTLCQLRLGTVAHGQDKRSPKIKKHSPTAKPSSTQDAHAGADL